MKNFSRKKKKNGRIILLKESRKMTERVYECIYERFIEGVPYGMLGVRMNLRKWLIETGRYEYSFEDASDGAILSYIQRYRGKWLREV